MKRTRLEKIFLFTVIIFLILITAEFYFHDNIHHLLFHKTHPPIKMGILHSLTGTMAISEKPVVDATLLAIEEINSQGGLLGSKIEPVIADGRSDPAFFAKEAERLITRENVKVIFGCWTSASRKSVKPVVEKYNSLLFYPVQYEGLERSSNIIYMGASPNQQIIPAVNWAFKNLGKKFFLIGLDYVFPRAANDMAKSVIGFAGGEILAEEYVLLGNSDFSKIVDKIRETKPDVILNTLNGDSNIAFLETLYNTGLFKTDISIMSLSMEENEIKSFLDRMKTAGKNNILKEHMPGLYACWSYFETIDSPNNRRFVEKFVNRYGPNIRITDPMEAASIGVNLWYRSVKECGDTDNSTNITNHLHNISFPAPEGIVSVYYNNHAGKTVRIGKVNANGAFDIVWASNSPIDPVPYPSFRDKTYWEAFLKTLYKRYNGQWSAGKTRADTDE
ncbi:MAG TPA: urea ABC transporter substrate-binding protein [Candidatus Omnitrophota bacterium]|nr:urea ABC transporter substrate-binding protein [Candidatus Omnitrophota bacterium]